MEAQFRYRAFISYSHADEVWAKWLHRQLERYRVPSRLVGRPTSLGPVPRRIGRCFRDQAELSAASQLGETLQQALRDSQALIVVCSPRSASSHWVNEEIRYFRTLENGSRIYALIVDGEPNAANPERECFPPALLRSDDGKVLHEPLAPDARSGKDGKTDAFLKLAASLVGVRFDELRQREQRRRVQMMGAMLAILLGIATVTTTLAITAFRARDEATLRRRQADDLINYMLGDLSKQLDSVNRLDILDGPVTKALEYLNQGTVESMEDSSLAQRAKALKMLSEFQVQRLHIDDAKVSAELALATAREQIRRDPESVDAKTSLAEILVQRASSLIQAGDLDAARAPLSESLGLWVDIIALQPGDQSAIRSRSYVAGLSGLAHDRKGNYAQSLIDYRQCAADLHPRFVANSQDREAVSEYFSCQSAVATESLYSGAVDESIRIFQNLLVELSDVLSRQPLLLDVMTQLSGMATDAYVTGLRLDLAEPEANRAVEMAHRLVGQDPANGLSKYWLGVALNSRCRVDRVLKKWQDLLRDATEEIVTFTQVLAHNPTDSSTQRLLIRAHDYRAIGLEHLGSVDAAISEWNTMVTLAKKDGSTSARVQELEAHVQIWRALGTGNPTRAKSDRAAAKALIESLDKVKKSALSNALFKLSTMKAAYLDGDVEGANRSYSELQTMEELKWNKALRVEVEARRSELCERLARQAGPRCLPEKTSQ